MNSEQHFLLAKKIIVFIFALSSNFLHMFEMKHLRQNFIRTWHHFVALLSNIFTSVSWFVESQLLFCITILHDASLQRHYILLCYRNFSFTQVFALLLWHRNWQLFTLAVESLHTWFTWLTLQYPIEYRKLSNVRKEKIASFDFSRIHAKWFDYFSILFSLLLTRTNNNMYHEILPQNPLAIGRG